MKDVVAALIWNEDKTKFLACQRPAHKASGLLWEFVGGKVEEGESLEAALIRECREELDVEIAVQEEFSREIHNYPDIDIQLILFNARIVSGEIKKLEHNDIRWISPKEIPNYTFCPADKRLLELIMKWDRERNHE